MAVPVTTPRPTPNTFNGMLLEAGLDPRNVLMVRHADGRLPKLYQLYLRGDERFDGENGYIRYQTPDTVAKFNQATQLAMFIGLPKEFRGKARPESLFMGVYERLGPAQATRPGQYDPLLPDQPPDNLMFYPVSRLRLTDTLGIYRNRLLIDWGTSFLTWCQWAWRQNKPVLEILPNPLGRNG